MEDDPEQGIIALIKSLLKKKVGVGTSNDLTEEIHTIMNKGQAKGLLSNEESHMVLGILDLKKTEAHSIMIPRTDISFAPINSTLGEIIKLVTDCGHTRIPIYNENVDEVMGILHAKDLLKHWGESSTSKISSEILRKPYFVPENRKVSELLSDLREKNTHMAIITDEYGGTAGIITIEDILEEIVGEIMDEHDNEEPLFTIINDDSILVDARLEVEKLEEYLSIQLPKDNFESVGGFIIHLLGRVPQVNEKVSFGDIEMSIQKADQRRIEEILITRKAHHANSSKELEDHS